MSEQDDEIILSELDDEELVQQMFDDLYDGLKEEIEEGVNILLGRDWAPYQVSMMMEGAGFEVVDLGINNPVENYLEAIATEEPDILGMSALLTTTMPYMKVVIDTLIEKGIRDDYVVLVGGAPLNEEFGKAIGADAYCRDAAVAVETAKEYMARKHNLMAAS